MDLNIMIVSGLTIVIAALIQGLTGFGFALVAVPILSSFLLPKEVVPMMVVYSLVMNILMFLQQKRFVQLKELRVLIVFGLIGIPFGVYLLNALSAQTIKLVAALLIIGTSMMMMLGWQWKTKSDFLSSAIAGLLSGILNGSTSMSGPPIVLFLANKKVGKESFRASLPTYGIITNLITLGFFLLSSNF
ncbi:MAG: sulfite exporter TauE/SafE family protein, partial [Vallitaleaceae bacterium]|nr:sulfite exporter TauE/SafE family protein [Vallitaleaceae bacterium]